MSGTFPEKEDTTCPLCGSTKHTRVAQQGQFGLPTRVVVCLICGFCYLSPRWTKDRYDRFYREEYDRYYRPEVITANDKTYQYVPVKKILARLEERNYHKHFVRSLDLGSGMGHALVHLRHKQNGEGIFEAIEPSPTCKEYMEGQGLKHISSDVYSDWDTARYKAYDLVIMRHVLEHFHEPLAVLKKVRNVLGDDGILYVAVPDAMQPTKPLRSHFFRVVHINYFTRRSLTALLQLAGLEVLDVVEGDQLEQHEVFAICRKGEIVTNIPDPAEHDRQIAVYQKTGRYDAFYELKSSLIGLLRRFHLIR